MRRKARRRGVTINRLPAKLAHGLTEAERIAAERFMPDSLAATLAEIPIEDARMEIRQLWRGMEDRGYCPLDALPRHFDGEGEGDAED